MVLEFSPSQMAQSGMVILRRMKGFRHDFAQLTVTDGMGRTLGQIIVENTRRLCH